MNMGDKVEQRSGLEKPHRFYKWPINKQRAFLALVIGLAVVLLVGLMVLVAIFNNPAFFLLWPLFTLLPPFLDTPLGQKSGSLTYYAPLFIVAQSPQKFVIHGGTLFDYLFVFGWRGNGRSHRAIVLYNFVDGLVNLIEELEQQPRQAIIIEGTSYFFNERNAQRLGFATSKPDVAQRIILTLNYLPLLVSYSLVQGKLSFPRLSRVLKAETNSDELIRHKQKLVKMRARLMGNGRIPLQFIATEPPGSDDPHRTA
ncbi:MAG: hypothetical protein KC445_20285 [Anaerolineales bacterium]|nr:hypothetical protein [Anaerolineales bacterium]